jgi:hypothetical protein
MTTLRAISLKDIEKRNPQDIVIFQRENDHFNRGGIPSTYMQIELP